MNARLICFDMDGVIIDSEPSHFEAFRLTFKPFGIDLSGNDYQRYFAGKTDEQGFADYIDSLGRPLDVPSLQTIKQNHYQTLAETTVVPYQTTLDMISRLGYEPSECFVVEDAPSGVLAAKRAGMYCIAITTTHAADQLVDADQVVETLSVELFNDR